MQTLKPTGSHGVPAGAPLPGDARTPAVEFVRVCKRFGAVAANTDVDLAVQRGSIHGLIGENGAGKSTLMGMLYGLHAPDSGKLLIDGKPAHFRHSLDAIDHGIGMVHQHFMLVDRFTVLENMLLGAERGFLLASSRRHARQEVDALARHYGLQVPLDEKVSDLPVGVLQRVEILKALYRGARTLILDEPTGVLSPPEAAQLLQVLLMLRGEGTSILLITHKLEEVLAVCDDITVMRAGRVAAFRKRASTDRSELATLMIGRQIDGVPMPSPRPRAECPPRLRFDAVGLRRRGAGCALNDISLAVWPGEIVGVAGVAGNGQSELLDLAAGLSRPDQGQLDYDTPEGRRVVTSKQPAGVSELHALGVAHVPEDRHRNGLVLDFPAWEVVALGQLDDPALRRGPLLDRQAMRQRCEGLMSEYEVRPPDPMLRTSKFSGGNQQKLVIGRELFHEPAVLLVGQPTRGVDIGAIEIIHDHLLALRDKGCAILLVSSDLDELLALSDRIVAMSDGRIVGDLERREATAQAIGQLIGGVSRDATSRQAA